LNRNLDGGDLAIGLQNGMIWIYAVLGNGDFQLRTDGKSQVKKKLNKNLRRFICNLFRIITHQSLMLYGQLIQIIFLEFIVIIIIIFVSNQIECLNEEYSFLS